MNPIKALIEYVSAWFHMRDSVDRESNGATPDRIRLWTNKKCMEENNLRSYSWEEPELPIVLQRRPNGIWVVGFKLPPLKEAS